MILSFDPGRQGAWAFLGGETLLALGTLPYPLVKPRAPARAFMDEAQLVDDLKTRVLSTCSEAPVCVIERVSSSPQMGVASAFSFGMNYGAIRGVCAGLGMSAVPISPVSWKTRMGLQGRDKNASRALAAKTWPDFERAFARVKDDGLAEAALLGLSYARSLSGR